MECNDKKVVDRFYTDKEVKVLSKALKQAMESVGCDLRCFDWLSYNPDFHINNQVKKAA